MKNISGRGCMVFLKNRFEQDSCLSVSTSHPAELGARFSTFKVEGAAVLNHTWLSCGCWFWLSKIFIFWCIRFKVAEGFLFPKYWSSTLVQPFFLPRNCIMKISSHTAPKSAKNYYVPLSKLFLPFCFYRLSPNCLSFQVGEKINGLRYVFLARSEAILALEIEFSLKTDTMKHKPISF